MKINWQLVDYDLLISGELTIPQCPTLFRTQAEGIIRIIAGMEPFDYSKISQFDKHLTIEYWRLDGLDKALIEPSSFRDWYLMSATNPTLIERARRWLMEHNYLIAPRGIEERAQEAGKTWGTKIKA